MTRDQLSAQDNQQDQTTAGPHEGGDIQGLPPHVYQKVMLLRPTPAGAETLADLMLEQDGAFAEIILRVAAGAPNLGNHVVQTAIQIARSREQKRAQSGGAATPAQQEIIATDDLSHLDANSQPLTLSPELRAQLMALGPDDAPQLARLLAQASPGPQHDALLMAARTSLGAAMVGRAQQIKETGGVPTDEAAQSTNDTAPAKGTGPSNGAAPTGDAAAKPEHSAGWVAAAEAYNRAHAHFVDEFNELTGDSVHLDAHEKLDVNAVAHWQRNHGLDPDGKVGPRTVQKAREVYASEKPQVASSAQQADARPPV
jgi:hypothetical protein